MKRVHPQAVFSRIPQKQVEGVIFSPNTGLSPVRSSPFVRAAKRKLFVMTARQVTLGDIDDSPVGSSPALSEKTVKESYSPEPAPLIQTEML